MPSIPTYFSAPSRYPRQIDSAAAEFYGPPAPHSPSRRVNGNIISQGRRQGVGFVGSPFQDALLQLLWNSGADKSVKNFTKNPVVIYVFCAHCAWGGWQMLSCRLLCDTLTFLVHGTQRTGGVKRSGRCRARWISFKFAVNAITWLPRSPKSASCFSHCCSF